MATVSRTALTSTMLVVLLLPMTLMVLLQGPPAPSAHAFPIDDFGDSIRLTFDQAISTNISSSVDDDGNIHVVWEDHRSGAGDIYYMKLDDEGNKLTNDAKISNDTTASRNPSVAADSDGHIYIVWEDVDNGSSELLFAKLWYYEGNITFQENGLQVSDSDPANSTEPDIAVCQDGNLALVWTDARHEAGDGNLEIYYKRLREAGTSLTPDTRVTGDVGRSEHPRLDTDADGMNHIVWYDFRDSSNGLVINHGVFYRKVMMDGTPLTSETRITFASPLSRPDIAIDTDGNAHVVFDDDRYASFDIFYTLLDPDGNTLVDDRNISPKDDTESRYPRIALSDSNAVDVVWQDQTSDRWAIHYSAMNYNGEIEVYDQGLTSDTVGNATIPVVMCANDNNTLVLYVGDYPNMEAFFSRTHRPDPAVLAGGVSLSSAQPMVGTTVWVNVTVWNLEGDSLTDLAVCLMIDSVAVENATVAYLAAGHSSIVGFSHMAAEGETVVTVAVDPDQAVRETFETNNQQSVPMLVRTPGVTLTSDVSSQSAEPDETAIFNLTITNEGNTAFSFCLSNSEPESGWIIDLGGSPEGIYTVPAGSSTVATVEVTVPEDETPGARAFSVLATCVERSSVNDSVTLMVDVVRFGELMVVSPDGGDVEPTIPEVYTFTVSNSANSNETFTVSASDLLGWDLVASHDELELAPGEEAEVSVLVTPARYDPPGTLNTLTLTLSSMNLTWNIGEGKVLMIVGHHWEVDAGLTDQAFLNMSVPDEREVRYTLDVTNLGNSDDVFRLSLSGIDGLWAVLNTTYVFLEAGGEQHVYLSLTPGADVLAGAYAFNVTIVSESDSSATETLEMGVSVLPFYDISVSADYSQVSLRRGETAYMNLTVWNIGNSADVVDLYAYVDDLNTTTATVGGEVVVLEAGNAVLFALEPGESATIMLTIPVPDDAESGLRELYIDLSSMTDPSVTASQAVSVLVEEDPSWLSLWIILITVGVAAAVVVLVVFLILRKRRAEEAAREEEQRKMQARRRPPGPPRAKPKAP